MRKLIFESTQFIKSVLDIQDCPQVHMGKEIVPEVAFVGRSNVGKSSLINHLTGCRSLAKTSSVPGKTQTINFFLVDRRLSLVDLPGYGYSQVKGSTKRAWADSLQNYLEKREELKRIFLLIDLRRSLSEEDKEFIEWSVACSRPLFFIFTKADKLLKHEIQATHEELLTQIRPLYTLGETESIIYSVKDIDCRLKLRDTIQQIAQQVH
jgi:GTP-binding protein